MLGKETVQVQHVWVPDQEEHHGAAATKPKDNIMSPKIISNTGSTGNRLEKPIQSIIGPSAKQSCYLMRKS